MAASASCPLCATEGGLPVWRGRRLRVIRAQEEGFPAFYRVVWNAHVAEFSDLDAADRQHCMDAVVVVERVLRERLAPAKIHLAALREAEVAARLPAIDTALSQALDAWQQHPATE